MAIVVNRYATSDLFIAREYREQLTNFVDRLDDGGPTSKSGVLRPFRRQIDAWWAALVLGVRSGQRTPLSTENRSKFNDGSVLSSDPWRITHLDLLALAEEGPGMLDRPADVVRMANEYANGGFEELLGQLVGQPEPTLNLMLRLDASDSSPSTSA